MSWRPTLWLLLMVVLTGVFVLVFEKGAEPAARALPVESPLLHVSPASITRLSIMSATTSVECIRREGEWFLTSPVEMRANSARIQRLIAAVTAIRKREVLDAGLRGKRGLSLGSFGLETPRARLVVGTDLRADEILLGDASPLDDLVYLRLNGSEDVIGAICKVSEILPIDGNSLRDRAVFPPAIRKTVRLELKHAGGFLQLALKDGAWRIQQPFDARADGARVERLIQSLELMTIENFGGAAALADPVTTGLGGDDSALQVSLWPDGRRDPMVLTVGKAWQDNPGLLYARVSDMAAVCAVKKEVLALQEVKAGALRDRRLCDANPATVSKVTLRDGDLKLVMERTPESGWMIMEPFRFPANARAVGALLRMLTSIQADEIRPGSLTNQIPEEVASMGCRVIIANQAAVRAVATNDIPVPAAIAPVWSYRLAFPSSNSANSVVFAETAGTLMVAPSQDVSRLWIGPVYRDRPFLSDPLPYMDRRMLDVKPAQVRRITLARKGREETVTAGADGAWVVDSPPEGQVSEGSIPALLTLAADLNAERIEAISVTNMVAYGVDDASPRVTFGLSGTGGIQKTILIGAGNGRDGVYAMVQGQDVVFVLSKSVAEALVRPLVTEQ
ncbi:MAG: DUF4340 domain-containing protein [bacterium]